MVDGMTVPQPRDKGWEREELGREVLKFCSGVGRQSQGVRGGTPTALPLGRRVKCYFSRWGPDFSPLFLLERRKKDGQMQDSVA